MASHSLGIVLNASTTVAVRSTTTYFAANPTNAPHRFVAQAIQFQALGTNTGTVFICNRSNPDLTTGLGVLVEIPAPSAAAATGSRPAWQVGVPTAAAALDANEHFILPSIGGEGVRVTVVRP